MKFMKYTLTLFISGLLLLSQVAQSQTFKIITIAGNGVYGFSNDGYAATNAELYGPRNIAVNSIGDVYFVDYFNLRVRKIDTSGIITTIAGNGTHGYSGDSSLGSSAQVNPMGVAVDKKGNVYISDAAYTIRKVNTLGIITTIAGIPVDSAYAGNGVLATNATFAGPRGIAVDTFGNIYIADAPSNVVRKIDALTGIITTVAGNDTAGYSPDGSLAIHAMLDSPLAVAVDLSGNLFITDYKNNIVRKVDPTGIINTYAGTYSGGPVSGYTGDNGLATAATLNRPAAIAVDTAGNLYIPDANNNVIRKVNKTTGIITTVVGNGTAGFGGDTYNALGANLYTPFGVAVDVYGSMYIGDANNQRVRKAYSASLGVNSVFVNTDIDVYPNPSSGQITLSGLNAADQVSVYDMLGRQVSENWNVLAGGSTQTFNVSPLATGVYMLQVRDADGNKKATARFIKE